MAVFTSYTALLNSYRDALANRRFDSWFYESVENSREMRTTYYALGSITKFVEWLEMKASEEVAGQVNGEISMCIGGFM